MMAGAMGVPFAIGLTKVMVALMPEFREGGYTHAGIRGWDLMRTLHAPVNIEGKNVFATVSDAAAASALTGPGTAKGADPVWWPHLSSSFAFFRRIMGTAPSLMSNWMRRKSSGTRSTPASVKSG